MNFILPPNITGHGTAKGNTPPQTDWDRFEQGAASWAMVQSDWDLQAVVRHVPGNFWAVQFSAASTGVRFEIRCNAHYPLIAGWEDGQYVNRPELEAHFASYFTLLPVAFLNTTLDSENEASNLAVSRLLHNEFAQFPYRNPHTLADIIFHQWA